MRGISPNPSEARGGGDSRKRIIIHNGTFKEIVALSNLFVAWQVYCKGKSHKPDIQEFEFRLEDNIFQLHRDLVNGTYSPGKYHQFHITDPKPRTISKAPVRDRLLHQAIYQVLYPVFDKTFIFNSYSCRNGKGTHRAFWNLEILARKVSRNYTTACWAIKMDIRKFFDSINHEILIGLLTERIADEKLLDLLKQVIWSFAFAPGRGMPLGNLTSQLFANIYLDPLDKFVKHRLRMRYYLRYADDFVLLSADPHELLGCLVEISRFLREKLKLRAHPNKVQLRKLRQGIDFVGYIALPHYRLPRRKTVKRMLKKLKTAKMADIKKTLPSYLGHIKYVNAHKLKEEIKQITPRF